MPCLPPLLPLLLLSRPPRLACCCLTGEVCSDTITKAFGPTKNVTDLARMVQAFLGTPNLGEWEAERGAAVGTAPQCRSGCVGRDGA